MVMLLYRKVTMLVDPGIPREDAVSMHEMWLMGIVLVVALLEALGGTLYNEVIQTEGSQLIATCRTETHIEDRHIDTD